MSIFDTLVFKGERHLKRGQGIIAVSPWIKNNKHINFVKFFKTMFSEHFQRTSYSLKPRNCEILCRHSSTEYINSSLGGV